MRNIGVYGGIIVLGMALFLSSAPAGETEEGEDNRFYLALRGGPGWADRAERVPRSGGGAKLKFESEYDVNLALGFRFSPFLRAEGEAGFVNMSLKNLHLKTRGETVPAHGHDRHYRGMVNLYLDGANSTPFTPFIGAGAGTVRANLDLSWALPATGQTVRADDWDWAFAWQFMAGISGRVSRCLEVEVLYRSHTNHSAASQPDVVVDGTRASFVQGGLRGYF